MPRVVSLLDSWRNFYFILPFCVCYLVRFSYSTSPFCEFGNSDLLKTENRINGVVFNTRTHRVTTVQDLKDLICLGVFCLFVFNICDRQNSKSLRFLFPDAPSLNNFFSIMDKICKHGETVDPLIKLHYALKTPIYTRFHPPSPSHHTGYWKERQTHHLWGEQIALRKMPTETRWQRSPGLL